MGVLYAGLMIRDGEPKLIEYNCRFSDPECPVLMMRLKSDLATRAFIAARDRAPRSRSILRWRDDAALTVVMAYPTAIPMTYQEGFGDTPVSMRLRRALQMSKSFTPPRRGANGNHIVADGGQTCWT